MYRFPRKSHFVYLLVLVPRTNNNLFSELSGNVTLKTFGRKKNQVLVHKIALHTRAKKKTKFTSLYTIVSNTPCHFQKKNHQIISRKTNFKKHSDGGKKQNSRRRTRLRRTQLATSKKEPSDHLSETKLQKTFGWRKKTKFTSPYTIASNTTYCHFKKRTIRILCASTARTGL
jgi:hypothetical protein